MRISSSQIFNAGLDSVQRHTAEVLDAQRQISSGNRYRVASDNALAAGLGVQIQFNSVQFEMFKTNQNFAQSNLDSTEAQLESITRSVDRFKTLMVQANSSTLGAAERSTIADELTTLKETIFQFASAKDPSGNAILKELDASETSKVYVATSIDMLTVIRFEEVMGRISSTASSGAGSYVDGLTVMEAAINAIKASPPTQPIISEQIFSDVESFSAQVLAAQVKIGTLGRQLESAMESAETQNSNVALEKGLILETDLTAATAQLTKSNALLQAAQAIISKLDINSLFQKL